MAFRLEGVFQIASWDELPYSESPEGAKISKAKVRQTYSGAIEGSSEIEYMLSYQDDKTATFVGYEKVSGSINGQPGSFKVHHNGRLNEGVASSSFVIVAGSGQGGFAGMTGTGLFRSKEHGQANYQMTVNYKTL